MEESHRGNTDLVVFCNGGSQSMKNVDRTQFEGTSTAISWVCFGGFYDLLNALMYIGR